MSAKWIEMLLTSSKQSRILKPIRSLSESLAWFVSRAAVRPEQLRIIVFAELCFDAPVLGMRMFFYGDNRWKSDQCLIPSWSSGEHSRSQCGEAAEIAGQRDSDDEILTARTAGFLFLHFTCSFGASLVPGSTCLASAFFQRISGQLKRPEFEVGSVWMRFLCSFHCTAFEFAVAVQWWWQMLVEFSLGSIVTSWVHAGQTNFFANTCESVKATHSFP